MKIVLMKKERLISFTLPKIIIGSYWITDYDENNKKRSLINVEAKDGSWLLKSNADVKILNNGNSVNNTPLNLYNFYVLSLEKENIVLYTEPTIDNTYVKLKVENNSEYLIGNDNTDITYASQIKNIKLEYKNYKWIVTDLNDSNLLYVNNINYKTKTLNYGDVIFICGLKIIVMKDYIYLNQISSLIKYNDRFKLLDNNYQELILDDYDEEKNIKPIYAKDDYFYKSPRFKTLIEKEELNIDAPPIKVEEKEVPLLYTIGPMLTMSMTSVVFALSAINNMTNNGKSLWTVLPTIVMSIAMLSSCLLWPSLTRKYEKKQRIKREEKRQDKYRNYIESKRDKIKLMMKMQAQILKDNYLSPVECASIILNKKTTLWNREIADDDFLSLRVGTGTHPLDISVKYHEEDFMMEEDSLKVMAEELVNETKNLENVPISYSLKDNFISGIVGEENLIRNFLNYFILQIVSFYAYDEVKIVFMTNEKNSYLYEDLKILPHIFSNDKQIRFFGTNINENKEISLYLERILKQRQETEVYKKDKDSYKYFKPYYVVISDDYDNIRSLEIVKDILSSKNNAGFSLLILNDKLSELPNECENFINIGEKTSGIFASEVTTSTQQEFTADFINNINLYECFKVLANTPIELIEEDSNLPKTISFLEMYNVGMVEQLNIENRYRKNSTVSNLMAPVGVDKMGELLYLDLHEKAHGPHGLIAGMTGSGKSEFIITYILSMAVNYSPDDVAFVLIDYKGGGLAGAFLNKETGIKLPHLAGTITNLDIADMHRSLASIESELRRRQNLFNIARDKYNESTIDIYKYQTLYKEGKVDIAIPHLIIICDEFAELKAQQPEFMDQLISTARIGRSLGVHLILATQKPTGVVNDQIWSNSKFRVCLKVQEKQDSMEMIKTPDAASITNVGRFYLQVGYNELFTLGQSAWCGAKYYPKEKVKKKIDTSINFIDNIGNIVKSADKEKEVMVDKGEEISNVLNYIIKSCNGKEVNKLWLDKLPEIIFVDDLKNKYNHKEEPFSFNPIIGEYDDPSNQRQGLLTLNLSNTSNTIIYGIPGSGKELLLSTLVFSLIVNHTPEEINIYIIDFGTELLKMYNNAPQVGDIVSSGDDEKIDKLFQMLEKEIEERKEKFIDYAGDYNVYIKNSQTKLPLILLILNNYDNFIEAYEPYFERLNGLIREGTKYGIITIMSTVGPNSIRYRLRQTFKNELCLQLSDSNDYYGVFGRFDKVELADYKGRGLVKLDDVFEYQVAYPCEEASLSINIKNLCNNLANHYNGRAKKIATLPSIVDINYLRKYITDLRKVPVGVNKNNLQIEYFNFQGKGISLITGQDISIMNNFLDGLIDILNRIGSSLFILDAEDITREGFKDNFDIYINNLYKEFVINKFTNNHLCIIIGLDSLLGKISSDTKNKLIELFNLDRELNNLSFVFVDAYQKLKKIEYEAWYKANVNNNSGIWIGNGIVNQYTILLNKMTKELREEIPDNFGYVIINGKTSYAKLVESSVEIEVLDE